MDITLLKRYSPILDHLSINALFINSNYRLLSSFQSPKDNVRLYNMPYKLWNHSMIQSSTTHPKGF